MPTETKESNKFSKMMPAQPNFLGELLVPKWYSLNFEFERIELVFLLKESLHFQAGVADK